jgi:hypothetical protein
MVAVGSRFALLATLCTVAVLSFNPLLVSAAVIDTRHSSQPATFERNRHGVKQQVIPLPNGFNKANSGGSTRDPIVEHSRLHKGKGKEREVGDISPHILTNRTDDVIEKHCGSIDTRLAVTGGSVQAIR